MKTMTTTQDIYDRLTEIREQVDRASNLQRAALADYRKTIRLASELESDGTDEVANAMVDIEEIINDLAYDLDGEVSFEYGEEPGFWLNSHC